MKRIVIEFRGEEYTIPETRAFEVGERVEDVATLPEVLSWAKKPKFFKTARCICVMLQAAGARVTHEDVHEQLIADFTAGNPAAYFNALASLVATLMNGAPQASGGGEPEKPDALLKQPS